MVAPDPIVVAAMQVHRNARAVGRPQAALAFTLEAVVDILTWLIVGLIAGLLASAVVGGIGYGLLGDIVVGIVGAVLGGWLFNAFGVSMPVAGLPGTILVAAIGAIVLLLVIRLLRPGRHSSGGYWGERRA